MGPLGFIGLAGPSSRISVDMAEPYRIHFNATTGNSENPESPMFKTTTADWLNGRYRVLSMLPEEFLKDPMGELTLNPQSGRFGLFTAKLCPRFTSKKSQ